MTKFKKRSFTSYLALKIGALLILSFFISTFCFANQITELTKAGENVKYYHSTKKITPKNANKIINKSSAKPFDPYSRKNNRQDTWIKVKCFRSQNHDILYFDDFFIDSISFYKVSTKQELTHISTQGLLTQLSNKRYNSEFPAITIDYQLGQDTTTYLIHLRSKKFFHTKLKATSFNTFFNKKIAFNRYEAFFLSCNLFLIVMCLILYIAIRKNHLLLYTFYLVGFFLYFGTSSLYKIFDVEYSYVYKHIFDYIYLLVNGFYYLYICTFLEDNNNSIAKSTLQKIKYYPLVLVSTTYILDVLFSETKVFSYLVAQVLVYLALIYAFYLYLQSKNKYILATLVAAAIFAFGTILKTGSDLNIIQSPWEDFYLGAAFQPIALIDMLFFALIIIIHYKETITENQKSIDTILKISTEKEVIENQIEQLTLRKVQLKIESENSQNEHKELIRSLLISEKGSQSISFYHFNKLFETDFTCKELIKSFIPNNNLNCKKCKAPIDLNDNSCNNCSKEVNPINYSVFKNIRFPLQKALFLAYKYFNEREDINYTQVAKKLDMNKKTVWNFCFKLEEKIKRGDFRNWTDVIIDI